MIINKSFRREEQQSIIIRSYDVSRKQIPDIFLNS